MSDKPCCPDSVARAVKRLVVGEVAVGIAQLDAIMEGVKELGLSDEGAIGRELLRRVRVFNYVPSEAEREYSKALLEEYRRREK